MNSLVRCALAVAAVSAFDPSDAVDEAQNIAERAQDTIERSAEAAEGHIERTSQSAIGETERKAERIIDSARDRPAAAAAVAADAKDIDSLTQDAIAKIKQSQDRSGSDADELSQRWAHYFGALKQDVKDQVAKARAEEAAERAEGKGAARPGSKGDEKYEAAEMEAGEKAAAAKEANTKPAAPKSPDAGLVAPVSAFAALPGGQSEEALDLASHEHDNHKHGSHKKGDSHEMGGDDKAHDTASDKDNAQKKKATDDSATYSSAHSSARVSPFDLPKQVLGKSDGKDGAASPLSSIPVVGGVLGKGDDKNKRGPGGRDVGLLLKGDTAGVLKEFGKFLGKVEAAGGSGARGQAGSFDDSKYTGGAAAAGGKPAMLAAQPPTFPGEHALIKSGYAPRSFGFWPNMGPGPAGPQVELLEETSAHLSSLAEQVDAITFASAEPSEEKSSHAAGGEKKEQPQADADDVKKALRTATDEVQQVLGWISPSASSASSHSKGGADKEPSADKATKDDDKKDNKAEAAFGDWIDSVSAIVDQVQAKIDVQMKKEKEAQAKADEEKKEKNRSAEKKETGGKADGEKKKEESPKASEKSNDDHNKANDSAKPSLLAAHAADAAAPVGGPFCLGFGLSALALAVAAVVHKSRRVASPDDEPIMYAALD